MDEHDTATKNKAKEKSAGDGKYLTPYQCASLIGVGRATLYRYLERGQIPCIQFNGKTLISRASIDKMFENPPEYIKRERKEAEPIEEFYTTKEILEKFGISNSWLFKMAKERKIPKTVVRGKTLWSRKHIDNALADKHPMKVSEEEWYSVEKVCPGRTNCSK